MVSEKESRIDMGRLGKIAGNRNAKAGMFYFIGNLFNKAIAFLTIPVFTRLLSTEEYGVYTTYSSWVPFMAVIVGMALGDTIRNAYVDYQKELDEYISSITILSLLNLLLVSILGILGSICIGVDSRLVLCCIIQGYMSNLTSGYALKYMMSVNYVKRMLLIAMPNALSMFVSIPVVYFMSENRYMGRIGVQVTVYLIIGGGLLVHIFHRGGLKLKLEYCRYAFPLALPMIFYGISVNILSNSDRSMITYFRGTAESGIYGLVYNISMVAAVITSAIENVWIPWFTNRMIEKDKDVINQRARLYIGVTALMMCGFMLVAPEILQIMAPEEYWSGKYMLAPLAMAFFFIFLYGIFVQVEIYYKRPKFLAINTMLAGGLNIVLNLILVPQYGALAAAYTTLISYIVSFILHYVQGKKLDRELLPLRNYIPGLVVCICIMICTTVLIDHWWIRWVLAFVFCLAYGFIILLRKG